MLAARNINWRQDGKEILKGIDFSLQPGEIVGLVGPNGSGKSSLIKILSFLLKPTSGKLAFRGIEIAGSAPLDLRRRIAVVFQEPLLLNATVFENVALGLKLRGTAKRDIRPAVEKWLDSLGILHLANRNARSLSGGEAQRVSLARAFVLRPEVLFLDEPFSSLDAPSKERLIEDVESFLHSTKTTALIVSHDFSDILRLAKRALVLIDGRIEAEGRPEELLMGSHSPCVEIFLAHWKK